jgi:hypothetical protein
MLVHDDYVKTNDIYIINTNISQIPTNNMKCVRDSNRDNLFQTCLFTSIFIWWSEKLLHDRDDTNIYNRQWCHFLPTPIVTHASGFAPCWLSQSRQASSSICRHGLRHFFWEAILVTVFSIVSACNFDLEYGEFCNKSRRTILVLFLHRWNKHKLGTIHIKNSPE